MSWYTVSQKTVKTAGVSLSIGGYNEPESATFIYLIVRSLYNIFFKHIVSELLRNPDELLFYNTNMDGMVFSPDGSTDDNDKTGVINFYVAGLLPSRIEEMLVLVRKFLSDHKITFREFQKEDWSSKPGTLSEREKALEEQLRNFETDSQGGSREEEFMETLKKVTLMPKESDFRVVRIPIVANPNVDIDRPPEVGMSYTMMENILTFLGYKDISKVVNSEIPLDANILEAKIGDFYHKGLPGVEDGDLGRISGKMELVRLFCRWATQHGFSEVYVS